MILEVDNWPVGYDAILQNCRTAQEGIGKCLILCHADVDALAAARILTYMLRADQIEYTLLPCATWSALQKAATGQQYSTIVLLNVGATRNLTKLFGEGDLLQLGVTKMFVLDGRRPVHLSNIYADDHVVVFWDSRHGSADDLPSDGDNLSGKDDESEEEEESSSESSDEELDDEDDDEDEPEQEFGEGQDDTEGVPRPPKNSGFKDMDTAADEDLDLDVDYDGEDEKEPHYDSTTPQKKKKQKPKTGEDASHETDSTRDLEASDDEDDLPMTPTATATTAPSTAPSPTARTPAETPAERHRKRQDRLRLYYSHGSSYGIPTAYIAHHISTKLRFANVADLLWLCMVGVTDAWLQSRLDVLGYAQLAELLQEACLKVFPNLDTFEKANSTVYAEELLVNGTTMNGGQNKTKLTFSEHGRIIPQTDHRFFLLRSSSLLDALQCSNYVSTQLQLWTKPGMQRLYELLARMGYPLEECQQPYKFLKPSLRRKLAGQLAEYAEVSLGMDALASGFMLCLCMQCWLI
jgi:cell division control protein 45